MFLSIKGNVGLNIYHFHKKVEIIILVKLLFKIQTYLILYNVHMDNKSRHISCFANFKLWHTTVDLDILVSPTLFSINFFWIHNDSECFIQSESYF